MCRPVSQGGQRCATHARKWFSHCDTTLQVTNAHYEGTARQVEAEHAFIKAARQYASTPTGVAQLQAELDALEATGLDPKRAAMLAIGIREGLDLRRANREAYEAIKRGEQAYVEPSPFI